MYVTVLPLAENAVTVAPSSTVMFDVPNVLGLRPEVASAYLTVIFVVLVPPAAPLIVGGTVVTTAVGGTVSTSNGRNPEWRRRRCPPGS